MAKTRREQLEELQAVELERMRLTKGLTHPSVSRLREGYADKANAFGMEMLAEDLDTLTAPPEPLQSAAATARQFVQSIGAPAWGSRPNPAQMGMALGTMFRDFLANIPKGSVAQNVAAATLGSKTEGAAQLVEAAAAQGSGTPASLQEGIRQNYGNYPARPGEESPLQLAEINRVRVAAGKAPLRPMAEVLGEYERALPAARAADARIDPAIGNARGYDPALDNFRRDPTTKMAYGESQGDYAERAMRTADPAYARSQDKAAGRAASDRSKAADPGQYARAAVATLDAQGATADYNRRAQSNDKIKHDARIERFRTGGAGLINNHADAIDFAMAKGASIGDAVKAADAWQKSNSEMQAQALAKMQATATDPKAKARNAADAEATQASVKRIAEVAAAARAAVAARRGGPGTPAAATPPAADKPTPRREDEAVLRKQTMLLNELKLDAAQLDNASKRSKQPQEAIIAAIFALTPEQRAAYKNIKDPDAKTDALILIINRFLAGGQKAPSAK